MTNLCCSEMMSGPRDRPSEGVPRGTSLFAWGDTPFSGHCSSRQGRRAASRLERAEVQQAPLHGGTGRRAPLQAWLALRAAEWAQRVAFHDVRSERSLSALGPYHASAMSARATSSARC
jgi:hypothetical protein